jgi:SSS family solute:Na+ symporter
MQLLILLTGLMVLVFHQFEKPPVFFNTTEWDKVKQTAYAERAAGLEAAHAAVFTRKRQAVLALDGALAAGDESAEAAARAAVGAAAIQAREVHQQARALVGQALPGAETRDTDYVFLGFVLQWLPQGLVGLLLAVILCAAMSSSASEIAALGSTTVVDFYKRSFKKEASDHHYLRAAQLFTVGWGVVAIGFAVFASLIDNLIQAVNIIGSLFYGTILGVFLMAFFTRRVRGTPVFVAALISQATIIAVFKLTTVSFLWWNVMGPALVAVLAFALNAVWPRRAAD